MQKTLRLLAVVLFLLATFAFASTPAHSTATVTEGSSPIPTCQPNTGCSPY